MSNNLRIRSVIWDMGGVLLRTEDRDPRTKLAQNFNMTYEELETLVFSGRTAQEAAIGRVSEPAHWVAVGRQLGLEGEAINDFRREFWAGDRMDYRLISYIDNLRPAFRTGLLSNAWSDARESLDAKYNFLRVFDVSIFSCETGLAKPDPKIYQYMLDHLGVHPQESVFIDDFQSNIDGALAVGMNAIRFTSPDQVLAELQKFIG